MKWIRSVCLTARGDFWTDSSALSFTDPSRQRSKRANLLMELTNETGQPFSMKRRTVYCPVWKIEEVLGPRPALMIGRELTKMYLEMQRYDWGVACVYQKQAPAVKSACSAG
jgi:hypothetical protein